MNPTILLPELPDTTDPKAVKEYLAAHQKILAYKQKDDYESLTGAKGLIFPVGTWYTQYPSAKSNDEAVAFPESEEPANKFGGVWTEPFAGDNAFFKVSGADGQTRIEGLSLDQMQKITGTMNFPVYETGGVSTTLAQNLTGVFSTGSNGGSAHVLTADDPGVVRRGVNFTSSNSTNARTSTETTGFTEPRNYLFKVWYRES